VLYLFWFSKIAQRFAQRFALVKKCLGTFFPNYNLAHWDMQKARRFTGNLTTL
jgi:hypothetical protein